MSTSRQLQQCVRRLWGNDLREGEGLLAVKPPFAIPFPHRLPFECFKFVPQLSVCLSRAVYCTAKKSARPPFAALVSFRFSKYPRTGRIGEDDSSLACRTTTRNNPSLFCSTKTSSVLCHGRRKEILRSSLPACLRVLEGRRCTACSGRVTLSLAGEGLALASDARMISPPKMRYH